MSICQRQLQPARNTWRGAPPGRASRGKWPLEKPRLVHRSCAFFSANKAWSGVSSQSPCLFREEGHSQWDFCPPSTALFSVTSLWNVGSPMGVRKLYLERCGRGENTGWQAHAVQAFDNTGTPQAGPGPDGSSGLVTLTRRKDRLGLWDLRGRPASSMGSQEVSQAEPGTEVQRGGRHRCTEALELQVAGLLRGEWWEDRRPEGRADRVAGLCMERWPEERSGKEGGLGSEREGAIPDFRLPHWHPVL